MRNDTTATAPHASTCSNIGSILGLTTRRFPVGNRRARKIGAELLAGCARAHASAQCHAWRQCAVQVSCQMLSAGQRKSSPDPSKH